MFQSQRSTHATRHPAAGAVCRAGFLLTCALPTLAIVAWGAVQRSAGHLHRCCLEVSAQLGLPATLASVTYPRPGLVVYEGLELTDPETGKPLLRIPKLQMTSTEAGTAIVANECRLEAAGTPTLLRELERLLSRKSPPADAGIRFVLSELHVHRSDGSSTLLDLAGEIKSLQAGRQARITFRLAGADSDSSAKLSFFRNQQAEPAMSGFELESPFAIPCTLLPPGNPLPKWLGPHSTFRGYAWARRTPQGDEIQLNDAEFAKIDMQQWVGARFGQTIRCTGTLTLADAEFNSGRLQHASGTFKAGPGFIGGELLESAVDSLSLAANRPRHPAQDVLFDELAFEYILDPGGIELWGACRKGPAGAILVDRSTLLAGEPQRQPQPVAALVRTLAPRSTTLVPANLEADWLLGYLPLPTGQAGPQHQSTTTGGKHLRRSEPR